MWAFNIRACAVICAVTAILIIALASGHAQDKAENYAGWSVLKSTFPSTGGNGVMIKGYDPVITGKQCVTTFMAALPSGEVYFNVVEFDAVPAQGGTLCTGGKWRSFDGKSTGTTPYRVFFKDGVFRGAPN
jgi:hypothetical protein